MKKFLVYFLLMASALSGYGRPPIKCGVWRWDIKTLADNSGIDWQSMTPVDATIEDLVNQQPPKILSTTSKEDGVLPRFKEEKQLVRITAYVTEIKNEADHDYHFVLQSQSSGTEMVGEIPDPDCPNLAQFPEIRNLLQQARKEGDAVKAALKKSPTAVLVEIIGVPFWDATHGQTGGASNGKEIHPIIHIKVLDDEEFAEVNTQSLTPPILPSTVDSSTTPKSDPKTKKSENMNITPTNTLIIILLGALLGMIGQGLRMIVGLKKLNDAANAQGVTQKSLFETQQLLMSLFIAFAIGALAGALAAVNSIDTTPFSKSTIIAFIAAGYAGTDFIEGFMNKNGGKIKSSNE